MIDWNLIVLAGSAAAVAMSLMLAAARAAGVVDASMSRYLGCMITGRTKRITTIVVGFALHLVLSVAIAIAYAWGFAQLWGTATWILGLLVGLLHWLLAGIFMPALDSLNRCVNEARLKPLGAFGSKRGAMMMIGFLMGHMLFGLIVGWLYSVPALGG